MSDERKQMTEGERGEVLARNYELVLDALEALGSYPTRHDEVLAVMRELREIHNHDPEDEHCTEDCPVWFPRAYCESCGVRHRQRSAVSP
jgi:hypothetical protein